jgi:hypothetical protein
MGRRFVTATEIDDLAASGRTILQIDDRTVLTDLARERARDRGIEIVTAEEPVSAARAPAEPAVSIATAGSAASVTPPHPTMAPPLLAPTPRANQFHGYPTGDDPLRVGRWSRDRAADWYRAKPWPVGCNYIPAYAANQLEMWQPDTFDLDVLTRELDLARSIGLNTLRVFLHDLLWDDGRTFLDNLDRFLTVAAQRGMTVMPVFFDGVWNNYAFPGPQSPPIPGIHNSRWLQSPSAKVAIDPNQWPRLEEYVSAVIAHFRDDERVLVWDLYNEPGNEALISNCLPLLDAVFRWARAVGPSQPLTSGIWEFTTAFAELNRFQLLSSDVLSFHHYGPVADLDLLMTSLAFLGRPTLCTEYMARPLDSTFATHLPALKANRVGAIHWGLVAGSSQTYHAWNSTHGQDEPAVWFHDVFRPDGTPYDAAEVALFRRITGAA